MTRSSTSRSDKQRFDSLIKEMADARRRTDGLFAHVPENLMFSRPLRERHRIAFYIGHLEAFDVNLLVGNDAPAPFDAKLGQLFAFGIDPLDDALPTDTPADWPPLDEIRSYADATRRTLDRWLDDPPARGRDDTALETLLEAAIEHRLMHAETLAYMLNRMTTDKPVRAVESRQDASDDDMVTVPAGGATLGFGADTGPFGWDNEFNASTADVPAFAIDRTMVTNGQFLRFVEAGGYNDPQWWTPDDWSWREAHDVTHPAAWEKSGDRWQLISFSDVVPFQGNWPVYVSHAEAAAYARWAGKRLPSEAEWHRAAYGTGDNTERVYPWGDDAPTSTHGNFDFNSWDPSPVDAHPAGDSAFGVAGLLGNGWEWTSTLFAPFDGFHPYAFYPGYSANFFDNRHFVLKGGSPHTAARFLRRSFRNWFQPHYPYVSAGFRCVTAS